MLPPALLQHPLLLGAALLFVLHRLGRRLYNAFIAEEPELYYLPTGLNRARPDSRRVRASAAATPRGSCGAAPARASPFRAAREAQQPPLPQPPGAY